jgi:hypothetical protein
VRPGTLAIIIVLLIAMLMFGLFLITYDNGRPGMGRPPATPGSQ